MLRRFFILFSIAMPILSASPTIDDINQGPKNPTPQVQTQQKRADWEHSIPTLIKALELIDLRLYDEFTADYKKKDMRVKQHYSVRSIQNITPKKDNQSDTTAVFSVKFNLQQSISSLGGTRFEVQRLMNNLQKMGGAEVEEGPSKGESQSRSLEKIYKIKFLSQPAYQANMPIQTKIQKVESQESPAVEMDESNKRYDVSDHQPNWEHSKETLEKALNMMISYTSRKFPVYAAKDGVQYHHSFTFDTIENLTPRELNAPDKMPPSRSFYQVQGGLNDLMAVFLFKVVVTQTKVGQAYPNPYAQQQQQESDNDEPKVKKLDRIYLISFPKQPFQRKSTSPVVNMLNAGMKAANLEGEEVEISYAGLKAQFPSNKVKVRSIKSEAELKEILSGKTSEEADTTVEETE
ncbi:MAG: hypothetical protein KC646_01440 [Candidatus Cloacimonetes bacterium]|nr:hypothetical protein [Candidatus Cloacimonadota bacterium]